MALWSAKPTKAATPRAVAPAVISSIFPRVMLTSVDGLMSPHFPLLRLVYRYPGRLQQRERDQAHDRGRGYQERVTDFPTEQHGERDQPDQGSEQVADSDASKQDACAQYCSDCCRIGTLNESLHIGIAAMTCEQRCGDEHQKKRREENADRRDHRAPEPCNEITDKGRGDHDRSRADHANGDSDQELALIQPAELLNKSLLKERHDHEAAPKGERASLEEEQQELAQD